MQTQRIPARPTIYNGIQMRSRLEAQFAERLDKRIGTSLAGDMSPLKHWEYEPQAYGSKAGQYLPDFKLTLESGLSFYVEIKALPFVEGALEKMHVIRASEPDANLVVMTRGNKQDNHFVVHQSCYGTCKPECGANYLGPTFDKHSLLREVELLTWDNLLGPEFIGHWYKGDGSYIHTPTLAWCVVDHDHAVFYPHPTLSFANMFTFNSKHKYSKLEILTWRFMGRHHDHERALKAIILSIEDGQFVISRDVRSRE